MKLLEVRRLISGVRTTLIVAHVAKFKAGIRDELIGSVEVRCEGHVAEIRSVYVEPGGRRQGVATLMLERCYDIARKAGCVSVTLSCRRRNSAARTLYKKSGFIIFDEDDLNFKLVKPLR